MPRDLTPRYFTSPASSASGLGVDVTPLIQNAVERGGHVRVGLEDAPLGTELKNVEWVERAKAEIHAAGGEIATPAEIRETLS